jgi:ribonuclease HI
VYFDGASRHNGSASHPSAAGWGVLITDPQGTPTELWGYLGEATNNVAEFTAFRAAAQFLSEQRRDGWAGAASASIFGDSQLLVDAYHRSARLRDPKLLLLLSEARCFLATVGPVNVAHVPRSSNTGADLLANRAVSSQGSNFELSQPLPWLSASGRPCLIPFVDGSGALPPPLTDGPPPFAAVLAGLAHPSPSDVSLPDPDSFTAGSLALYADRWDQICSNTPQGADVRHWARHGVDVRDFFTPFRGEFMGRSYDSLEPPRAVFNNHALSDEHTSFVSGKIAEELRTGAIRRWGLVGQVAPPHLVLPIGVEPSKPRKLNDARFLNLWCKDTPFSYEGLGTLPALADKGEFAFNIDHCSGYWHVPLTIESQTFFGFQWEGTYYVYTVLSFGWSNACMIYTCFSGEVAAFLRRLRVRTIYLLDDSLGLQLARIPPPGVTPFRSACSACFLVVSLMVGLGYFVHPTKSVLVPSQLLLWLGLMVNFLRGSFDVPAHKVADIAALLRLARDSPNLLSITLERLVGKLVALSLAVPGALIRCRQMYAAIAAAAHRGTASILWTPLLRAEIEGWIRQPFWQSGSAGWKEPWHLTLALSDPPTPSGAVRCVFACPAVEGTFWVGLPSRPWAPGSTPPALEVGLLLLEVLSQGLALSGASDCFVTVLACGVYRPTTVFSSDLSSVDGSTRADRLFQLVTASRVVLAVSRIPDMGSAHAWWRAERGAYRLCSPLWGLSEHAFGPHEVDAMGSDHNAQVSISSGSPLPRFTRWPSAASAGTNLLSQDVSGLNVYSNPVFAMMGPVLHFFRSQRALVTLISPGWDGCLPSAPWWPILLEFSVFSCVIARRGQLGVFDQVSLAGDWLPAGPVPWDVWMFRLDFSTSRTSAPDRPLPPPPPVGAPGTPPPS